MKSIKVIGVSELQEHASEVLRQVPEEGQVIDITDHGQLIARLTPIDSSAAPDADDEAVWADLQRLSAEISAHWPSGVSAVEAVRDVRREL